jgi:hypothetical protein
MNGIFRQAQKYDPLTPEQREAAWKLAFRTSIDELPDTEITWECETWRTLGAPVAAAITDELLSERARDAFTLPGGADATGLDRLWLLSRVHARAVMRLVEDEGLCLVAAMRLVFWSGLTVMEHGGDFRAPARSLTDQERIRPSGLRTRRVPLRVREVAHA